MDAHSTTFPELPFARLTSAKADPEEFFRAESFLLKSFPGETPYRDVSNPIELRLESKVVDSQLKLMECFF